MTLRGGGVTDHDATKLQWTHTKSFKDLPLVNLPKFNDINRGVKILMSQ